jgi:hypothetical protein
MSNLSASRCAELGLLLSPKRWVCLQGETRIARSSSTDLYLIINGSLIDTAFQIIDNPRRRNDISEVRPLSCPDIFGEMPRRVSLLCISSTIATSHAPDDPLNSLIELIVVAHAP